MSEATAVQSVSSNMSSNLDVTPDTPNVDGRGPIHHGRAGGARSITTVRGEAVRSRQGRAAKASIWSTWPETMRTSSGCTVVVGIA